MTILIKDLIITEQNCLKQAYKEVDAIILLAMTFPFQKKQMEQYLKDMRLCFDKYEGDGKEFWKTELEKQEDNFHKLGEINMIDCDDMKGTIHRIIETLT